MSFYAHVCAPTPVGNDVVNLETIIKKRVMPTTA